MYIFVTMHKYIIMCVFFINIYSSCMSNCVYIIKFGIVVDHTLLKCKIVDIMYIVYYSILIFKRYFTTTSTFITSQQLYFVVRREFTSIIIVRTIKNIIEFRKMCTRLLP